MKNYKKLEAFNANQDLSKSWYISYYYLNPQTGNYQRFRETCNINRFHTLKERKGALLALLHAKKMLLDKGYSPFEDYNKEHMLQSVGLLDIRLGEAIDKVLEHKKLHIAPTSYTSFNSRIQKFKDYLLNNKLLAINPNDVNRRVIMEYLDYRTTSFNISGRTRNNDLIDIKSLFSTMLDLEIIKENPATRVKKVPTSSERNEVYTDKGLNDLLKWLENNNPYLLLFCKFIYFAMIRPVEITRLQIKDIDLDEMVIHIPAANAKARRRQSVPMMEALRLEVLKMNLDQYPKDYYLFSAKKQPWIVGTTRDYFTDKFKKAKKELGITENHTMYSLKHTVICKLRSNGANEDDVRKYSRHTSQAFEAYVKYYNMQKPKDLSSFL